MRIGLTADSVNDVFKLYVNGVEEGSLSVVENPVDDTDPLRNISWMDLVLDEHTYGTIDEIKIYHRLLTPAEIQALANP